MIIIRYHFSFPGNSTEEQISEVLNKLRQVSLDQAGFDSVDDLRTQTLTELRLSDDIVDNPQQYFRHLNPRIKIGFVAKLGPAQFEACLYGYPTYGGNENPAWFYDGQSWLLTRVLDDEYIRRHIAVVSVLKVAQELIPITKVQDEAQYWDHQSRTKLLVVKRVMSNCPDPRDLRISTKI